MRRSQMAVKSWKDIQGEDGWKEKKKVKRVKLGIARKSSFSNMLTQNSVIVCRVHSLYVGMAVKQRSLHALSPDWSSVLPFLYSPPRLHSLIHRSSFSALSLLSDLKHLSDRASLLLANEQICCISHWISIFIQCKTNIIRGTLHISTAPVNNSLTYNRIQPLCLSVTMITPSSFILIIPEHLLLYTW